jgi:putative tricarboxylic transport membrane protein
MRRIGPDAIIGCVLLVLSAELYRETFNFRIPPFATMSTGTWPRFVLILLALLSVLLLVQSLLQRLPAAPAGGGPTPDGGVRSHRNALVCFGLFAAFLVSLHWLGMLIAGMAFVFLMQEIMGPRDFKSRLVHLAIAVVSVGGMWAVFTFALRVILPEGVLLRI